VAAIHVAGVRGDPCGAKKSSTEDWCTPLNLAALNGKIEIVRYLTESGADTNICDVH